MRSTHPRTRRENNQHAQRRHSSPTPTGAHLGKDRQRSERFGDSINFGVLEHPPVWQPELKFQESPQVFGEVEAAEPWSSRDKQGAS